MDSKTALFNRAKEFIYSSKLEDLHIFSKEYLNSVLKPYYSCNNETDNYASICIDYNKLNDINNIHGYETGDKVMHYSLSLMKSVLPQDCICARIAGDEFVFIINNCDPERIDYYTQKIDQILEEHEKELLFCSVTSYGVHSSEKESLSEMMAEADVEITKQKNNLNNISSHSRWSVLEDKIKENINNFFKNLRFTETFTIQDLCTLLTQSINSCNDLLEHDFSKAEPNLTEINLSTPFDRNELQKLHSIFVKKEVSSEEIESIDVYTYSSLLSNLIRDPSTGAFSKGYFQRYLLSDCKQEYNVKYVSTAFVKLYNTIFSHNATDIKINQMTDDLTNYLKENENITFCDNSFLSFPQNHLISLGAGDYLIALPKESEVDNDNINTYLSSITKNKPNLENILQLFYSKDFHRISKENCDDLLNSLSKECKTLKDEYKLSILDTDAIKDALNNIIYDSTEYYINNIHLNNTMTNKQRFLTILAKTILNATTKINKENSKEFEDNKLDDIKNKEGR